MSLQYLRPVLFVFTFIVGFWAAPIRFDWINGGVGALTGGHNACKFSVYSSTYLEQLSQWSCTFENESQARDYLETLSPANPTLQKSESYVLIRIAARGERYYCSSRLDGRFVTNICSGSLRHVKAYERQMDH